MASLKKYDDHESVVTRLEEVASLEYPFRPIPKFIKPKNKAEFINLKSRKNVLPLLKALLLMIFDIIGPPLMIVLISLGWYHHCNNFETAVGAIICVRIFIRDKFFIHFITDGRFGGLGSGSGGNEPREGFYCNEQNHTNVRIRSKLKQFVDDYSPTPYLFSGGLLTLAPFLFFKGSIGGRVPYTRYWIKVPAAAGYDGDDGPTKKCTTNTNENDQEAVAVDIVFPKGGYQPEKPFFLVLHGLNGGSTEPYILDLARNATDKGCAIAVMINRGLMKTPIKGYESFHGARTSDVSSTVDALNYALCGKINVDKNNDSNNTMTTNNIILVGFSMGGIIASNYASKSKSNSGIAGAVSFSGSLCVNNTLLRNPATQHSLQVWQPALAWGLKASIIKPLMPKFVTRNITVNDVEKSKTVMDIDADLVCKYHGYKTVHDYYEDMSAGGLGDSKGITRLKGTQVPLLTVHAIDDPIAAYEVTLQNEIEKTDNVMLLATKHGGHIGWPTGWFPSKHRWKFMIDITLEYAFEIVNISQEQQKQSQ